jgi:hypothetical protein
MLLDLLAPDVPPEPPIPRDFAPGSPLASRTVWSRPDTKPTTIPTKVATGAQPSHRSTMKPITGGTENPSATVVILADHSMPRDSADRCSGCLATCDSHFPGGDARDPSQSHSSPRGRGTTTARKASHGRKTPNAEGARTRSVILSATRMSTRQSPIREIFHKVASGSETERRLAIAKEASGFDRTSPQTCVFERRTGKIGD